MIVLVTVANAEPAAPQPHLKIKMGFKTILIPVPTMLAIIDCTANPSVLRILVGVRPKITNGAPHAITK